MSITENTIKDSFKKENLVATFEIFNGECSKTEINRLKKILKEKNLKLLLESVVEKL